MAVSFCKQGESRRTNTPAWGSEKWLSKAMSVECLQPQPSTMLMYVLLMAAGRDKIAKPGERPCQPRVLMCSYTIMTTRQSLPSTYSTYSTRQRLGAPASPSTCNAEEMPFLFCYLVLPRNFAQNVTMWCNIVPPR